MKLLPLLELRRILVVRSDHVGDLICSTPFLRALRQACPQARLDALVPPLASQALQGNPNVTEVFTDFERDYPAYDLAVALSPRTRTYRLVARTGARFRAGYVYRERILNRLLCRWWLTHAVEISVRAQMRAVPHEVEQHARFAEALGIPTSDRSLELPLDAAEEAFGDRYRGHVALHFAPGWLTRSWTVADFLRLARAIAEFRPLVVTYGPQERELLEPLREAGLPLLGELTLKQWAAVLGASLAVVSPDTGAVHVAAARGRPVVVVYQSEHFQLCSQQWSPWQVPHRNLCKAEPAVTKGEVLAALRELLEDLPPASRNSGESS